MSTATSGPTIRIGFLGTGLIATFHSKSLRAASRSLPYSIVRAGAFDPDPDRLREFCAASGHHAMSSEEEVIESCDAVYVCTWTSEHERIVTKAVAAGRAVFCEKPLSVDLRGARSTTLKLTESGTIHQVGLILRRSPAYLMARHLIDDPAAGPVMSVVFRDDQFIPTQGHYASTWRGDATKAGAGTLIEHSIHDIDMLHALVGPIRSVSARRSYFHDLPGIEDVLGSTFTFESPAGRPEAIGTLVSIWHDNLSRPSLRRVEVFCANRHIVIDGDDWTGPVTCTDLDGSIRSWQGDELRDELSRRGAFPGAENPDAAFIRAIAEGTPSFPDATTALRAHEVVEAMYRSSERDGATVSVRPDIARLVIRRASTAEVRPIRLEVLRRGMTNRTVVFEGDDDYSTIHLVAECGADTRPEIVGTSTWLQRPFPGDRAARAVQLRGMATVTSLQSGGVGARLLEAGLAEARLSGAKYVWANARDVALEFYQRYGMTVWGDGFIESVTQLPHHVVVIAI